MLKAMDAGIWPAPVREGRRAALRWWPQAAAAAGALGLLALVGRILAYPLQHDEQFYVPAGILFSFAGLYDDLGFSHFPNLPLLLAGLYRTLGTDHYLLAGRLVVAAAWIASLAALLMIGRDHARSRLASLLMPALLLLNTVFLEEAGMAVTNNFLPVPFALFGIHFFLKATGSDAPRPGPAALSGLLFAAAAGFKANYLVVALPFALAALLVPPRLSPARRVSGLALPMLIGGLIGGAPTLYFLLADPAGFIAHTFSFHRGPQIGFWSANADPANPLAIGLRDKYLLASRVWLAGAPLVLAMSVAILAVLKRAHRDPARPGWPLLLLAAATAFAALAAFAPSPAFPQYFTPPIPLGIVLLGLLCGSMQAEGRAIAGNVFLAALAMLAVIAAPMLLTGLPALARPGIWTGNRVHRDALRMAALFDRPGPVATLAPLHPLEGGLTVYPQLALGPFVYRALDWVEPADAPHFRRMASPRTLAPLLGRNPPAAVLIGFEDRLDAPFAQFALRQGYRPHLMKLKDVRAVLLVAPPTPQAAPGAAVPPAARVGADRREAVPAR